jgi:isoleucyl-tRNA synthetase
MSEIKKKYNHFSIESDLLKKNFFQKIYNNKEKNTPNSIITQLPIYINQDIKIGSIRDLIKESVIITYKNMQGSSIKLLPIFDTE